MHAVRRFAMTGEISFFCREAKDRRKPNNQMIEEQFDHRAHSATTLFIALVAIQAVLTHIKVKRRQIHGAEIV